MATLNDTIRRDKIVNGVSSLFTDPRYSDLKIKSGGRSWNVHKAIVCMRCNFFDGACKGGFQDATSNCITLDDDDPDAVNALLEYIYTSDFKDDNDENLSLYVLAAIIGDKYTVPELVLLGGEKFADGVEDIADWDTKPSEFTRAVALLYSGSDNLKKLRSIVVDTIVAQGDKILPYGSPSALRGVVEKAPPLAVDLFCKSQEQQKKEAQRQEAQRQLQQLQLPLPQIQQQRGYQCPSCGHTCLLNATLQMGYYCCRSCNHTLPFAQWRSHWHP